MGAGRSHSLQPNEEPSQTETQNSDTRAKVVAQVKVKPPHNYEVLLRDADSPVDRSSMDKLYDQLCSGVLLNHKREKYWVDKNSKNCFFLYARNLTITWGADKRYWQWRSIQETST
ncbi:hypothetical protein I3760_09G077500 [Carya illinoinensis]|nr:hypothetical protein I3760_09G077500 [Carya illinoinensis]